ncbi:MAG: SUMF1/EgtB/PvdO family nonheme iron enzyme [Deltaproteobacteria bacterium]|nr:SUMF1/EgtB/PvdO family nonheme iron enzyme [Deltaproteobacteria bacterium]
MVLLETFCIDSTEVTASQYQAFLDSNPLVSDQIAECSFNGTYVPDNGGFCGFGKYDPAGHPDEPIVCVDWCDAYAYCRFAGKRLCGRKGGGSVDFADYQDATKSEWFDACSDHGARRYPYGDTYQSDSCNGLDHSGCKTGSEPGCRPLPAGTLPSCASKGGILDLSGNVAEWEDSCDGATGKKDGCRIRGGTVAASQYELICSEPGMYYGVAPRDGVGEAVGIRCCADPK